MAPTGRTQGGVGPGVRTEAGPGARPPAVVRRRHAVDATRLRERWRWVVSFSIRHFCDESAAYRSRAGSSGSLRPARDSSRSPDRVPFPLRHFGRARRPSHHPSRLPTRRASEFDVRVLRPFAGFWRAPHQHGTSSGVLEHHRSAQVLPRLVHAVPDHPPGGGAARRGDAYQASPESSNPLVPVPPRLPSLAAPRTRRGSGHGGKSHAARSGPRPPRDGCQASPESGDPSGAVPQGP